MYLLNMRAGVNISLSSTSVLYVTFYSYQKDYLVSKKKIIDKYTYPIVTSIRPCFTEKTLLLIDLLPGWKNLEIFLKQLKIFIKK